MRFTLAFLLLGAACTPAPKRTSMKGWELYCRRSGADAEVTFVLLAGTNRLKAMEEIEGAPDAATGPAGARRLLETLEAGQTVICCLPRVPGAAERGFFRPARHSDLGKALQKHAKRCRLELEGLAGAR